MVVASTVAWGNMGVKHHKESSPLLAMMVLILLCVLTACIVREWRANPLDSVEKTESCASIGVSIMRSCIPCEVEYLEQFGSHVRNHNLEDWVPEVEPHQRQDLVIACISLCLSGRKLPTMVLICGLVTIYVLKSKVTRKVSSKLEDLSPDQSKEATSEEQTEENDFLRDTASLYQEAVREVDFVTVGRRVGLDDYQIQEIINNQAEQLKGEAKLKYQDWNSSKSSQSRDDLRDDIVAERIKLLPDILVQYKRPQGRAAYGG
ncbi:hypothetical protein Bbelb_324390 [Branchiostoma belcheri]|nr:hypothetical protein Bbelb_324390 [Branchiostoma belcheri]